MTTNYHTPIANNAALSASVLNAPLSQLDSKITAIINGAQVLTISTVAITGGAINGTPIGASTPSTGSFSAVGIGSASVPGYQLYVTQPSGTHVIVRLISTGAAGSYIQLGAAAGTNEFATDVAGDWVVTSTGVAAGVFKMVHAGAVTGTLVLTGGAVQMGGALDHDGTLVGFFGATPVVKQASGANLTNNVTAGGTDDTITNWTNLSTYSTDAAAIRNAVYQLTRKVKQINDGLRLYGLLT